MIRYLLDTDHVSLHERGHPSLRERLKQADPSSIAISIVTAEEMLRGRLAMVARRPEGNARVHSYGKLLETIRFLGRINIVSYDDQADQRFRQLRSMRSRVGTRDLRIAATALARSLTVVTRNQQDFVRVPDLAIEDWTV